MGSPVNTVTVPASTLKQLPPDAHTTGTDVALGY